MKILAYVGGSSIGILVSFIALFGYSLASDNKHANTSNTVSFRNLAQVHSDTKNDRIVQNDTLQLGLVRGHIDWIINHAMKDQTNIDSSPNFTIDNQGAKAGESSLTMHGGTKYINNKRNERRTVTNSVLDFTPTQWEDIAADLNDYFSPATSTKVLPEMGPKEEYFVTSCINYHLSDPVTQDKKISQIDTTNFFIHFCIDVNICSPDFTIPWEGMPVMLQLNWVWALCPVHPTLGEDKVCLDELDVQFEETGEFGFIITGTNQVYIEDAIENYCLAAWRYSESFHGGTEAPTSSPTKKPTVSPTTTPSAMPTLKPSISPTPGPTERPSIKPTNSPSSQPTVSPTRIPTRSPSNAPTEFPSPSPTVSPTAMPSASPTLSKRPTPSPTGRPTYIGSASPTDSTNPTYSPTSSPSAKPTRPPSAKPTAAPTASPSARPTAMPTVLLPQRVLFTYILGFLNDAEKNPYEAKTLDDSSGYVYIMDDVKGTINQILFELNVRRKAVLSRTLNAVTGIEVATEDPINSINTKKLFDEDPCPDEFSDSDACVIVVTEVSMYVNQDLFTSSEVENFVELQMKTSMSDGTFLQNMSTSDVKEIQFVGLGDLTEPGGLERPIRTRGIAVGSGEIAGVASASAFVAVLIAIFAIGRRRSQDDRIESDDEFDGDDLVPLSPKKARKLDASAVQMDLETGDVILVSSSDSVKSGSGSSSSSSSEGMDSVEREAELLIKRLDHAVTAGDWAAVAAIAGDLSTNDDVSSTYSSMNSESAKTPKSIVSKADSKRTEKIDNLIKSGDWNAVGRTAEAFVSEDSSSASSFVSGDEAPAENVNEKVVKEKKKSLIDFIAGPWQSAAAEWVLDKEKDTKNIEVEQGVAESDGISSLSGGLSPARKKDMSELDTITKPSGFGAISSESEATDDDTRPILAETSNKSTKRGWRSKIPTWRKKQNDQKTEARALALQEDSSVSSWSHGDSSNEAIPYVGRQKPKDEMPEEMKVFGEEFGIAAAEHEIDEENSEDEGDDDDISQKSSNSLRDELDKAIETGDWAALEAQTNKMFDLGVEETSDDDTKKGANLARNNLSFDDSDDDSESGWSSGSKSAASPDDSEEIDDERIAYLERLIETDDWQGVVSSSMIHNAEDSSLHSSTTGDENQN